VVVQARPGGDWIRDRWQAASDMHGKRIPGPHWIVLEFGGEAVVATKIVLDWETAYADEYVLEASNEPFGGASGGDANNSNSNDANDNDTSNAAANTVWTLFDGRNPAEVSAMRSVTESGKSPGVNEPRPLHVVHEIDLQTKATRTIPGNNNSNNNDSSTKAFQYLRLRILKSVTGWGVSLWQFDVYGFRSGELQTSR